MKPPRSGGRRGGGGSGRRDNRGTPLEPPPGVAADPRGLRDYMDLDAPSNEPAQIDWGTPTRPTKPATTPTSSSSSTTSTEATSAAATTTETVTEGKEETKSE